MSLLFAFQSFARFSGTSCLRGPVLDYVGWLQEVEGVLFMLSYLSLIDDNASEVRDPPISLPLTDGEEVKF